MNKPYLIIVTGRWGSGKTTFSQKLGSTLYLPVLSRDAMKEGYVHTFGASHRELPDDTNKVVTDLFFDTIKHFLENNVSLVAEAAFQHKVWESKLKELEVAADIHLLICETDPKTAKERFLERGMNDPRREYFHGDKAVQDAREGKEITIAEYEVPNLSYPTIAVDTTGDYIPSIDDLEEKILNNERSVTIA